MRRLHWKRCAKKKSARAVHNFPPEKNSLRRASRWIANDWRLCLHGAGEISPSQAVESKRDSILGNWHRNRLTNLAPTGKIPLIGKAAALLGLHGMNPAGVTIEHDALVVFLLDE